jgi:glyoxylase-like metal-dependent hydrolase (beta-lactamase superfamily II)
MKFDYGNIVLETIHIPGHSPGQTAYLISNKTCTRKDVLFVSDIGIERSGPWYGLKHCNLNDYRNSIEKVEDIYLHSGSDDVILASGHSKSPYFIKQPEIFRNTLEKIEINETRVLSMFNADEPKKLNDVTLKGVYYPEKHIKNLFADYRKIHFFWEWYIIFHHINELIEKGKLIEVDPEHKSFILK